MFDTIELLKAATVCPANGSDDDPARAFSAILARSAAKNVTLAPAASALFALGEQLVQQDGADGKTKKDKKAKKLKKNTLVDDLTKSFYLEVVLAIRLFIEDSRRMGALVTVRTVKYMENTGLTGIAGVDFTDVNGIRYSFNSGDGKVRRSGGLKRLKCIIEVIKPDGTVVFIVGQ